MAAPAQGIDGITTRGELQRFVEERVLGDLPQRIARLVGALAGLRLRVGTQVLTWPGGSRISGTATVTHGLGKTPLAVLATPIGLLNALFDPFAAAANYGATTFQLNAAVTGTPGAGTVVTVAWLAVG